MRQLWVFTKKELREQLGGARGLSLVLVLLLFAVASPLMARFLPEIMAPIMEQSGMAMALPPVSFTDAYLQFFSNLEQIIMIMIILLYSGIVNGEVSKGTIVLPLSRGLSRQNVVLGKFLGMAIVWMVGYLLSSGAFCLITQLLFPEQNPQNLLLALLCVMVYFLFLQALVVFFSALLPKGFLAMLASGGVVLGLYLLNIFPKAIRFSPMALIGRPMALIAGDASHIWFPLVLTLVLIPMFLGAGMGVFGKKEI